jgi:hypothetical protein
LGRIQFSFTIITIFTTKWNKILKIQNKMVRYSLITWTFFLIAFIHISPLWATTYHVAPRAAGSETGADCDNAKTRTWFDNNAIAGDTAILCDGTYTNQISPANSGTSGNPITYIADNQYGAVISVRSGYGAFYPGDSDYITLDGLYFNDCGGNWINLKSGKADYITIQNCKFYDADKWSGILIEGDSDNGRIINCIFEDAPLQSGGALSCFSPTFDCSGSDCNGSTAPADIIQFGSRAGGDYWIIEGNTFGNATHAAIYVYTANTKSTYIVARNNIVSNGYHHGITLGQNGLAEGNIIIGAGSYKAYNPNERDRCDIDSASAFMSNGQKGNSLWRNNIIVDGDYGLYFGTNVDNTYIYNNTLYNNWWAVIRSNAGHTTPNYLKNNLIYSDESINTHDIKNPLSGESTTRRIFRDYEDAEHTPSTNYYINNAWTPNDHTFYVKDTKTSKKSLAQVIAAYPTEWDSSNFEAEPKFVDAADQNFRLQSSSVLVDSGAWLSTITSASAPGQTSFNVADARYFYDGWNIPGEKGDVVKTQGGKVATIKSISYETNTITVNPPIDIVKGEGLALNYSGSAPDIGAHEHQSPKRDVVSLSLSPPKELKVSK